MEKSWKFQGVRGSNVKPSDTENLGGVGVQSGYGYFLEPHIKNYWQSNNYAMKRLLKMTLQRSMPVALYNINAHARRL